MVGKIDNSQNTIGGLMLGYYQRRALSLVLVKESNTGRSVGVLGLRTCILWRNKVVVKWASQLAIVHCNADDSVIEKKRNLHIPKLVILEHQYGKIG